MATCSKLIQADISRGLRKKIHLILQTAVFGGQQGRLFRPCRAAISGQYSENHQQGEALPAVRLLL